MKLDKRKLRAIMAARGVSGVPELARMSGVHQATIYHAIHHGKFRSELLERVCKALHCNPIDILDITGYPPPIDFSELGIEETNISGR